MLKLVIAASISITYILSSAGISDAGNEKSKNQVAGDSSMAINISCKTLSSQDIKSIHKLITTHYKEINSLDVKNDFDSRGLRTFSIVNKLIILGCKSQAYTRNTEVYIESTIENSEYARDLQNGSANRTKKLVAKNVRIDTYVKESNGKWKAYAAATTYP